MTLARLLRCTPAGALCAAALGIACAALAQGVPQPAITAPSYAVIDYTSGQTIVAGDADQHREPASLTKLMTAYLTFAALRDKTIAGSQMVTVSPAAWRAEGSRMFIDPRKVVTVDELLKGLIVQSGNDAAIALAELVAGSESAFAAKMNAEGARLGLKDSHFTNSTGLTDRDQYTSALDMARLAAAVIRDFPEYYPLYALRDYHYNNITQPNRNRLLWIDPYVDGVKTGHTDGAGWCLIASAKRGDRRLIAVVLGASSDATRTTEAQKLLNYGFIAFDTVQLYAPGKPVANLRVWKGEAAEVPAGFNSDQYLTVPKGKADKLALTMVATEPLIAPVNKGQPLGSLKVSLEGKPMAEYALVALADIGPANIFRRAWDTVRLWLK